MRARGTRSKQTNDQSSPPTPGGRKRIATHDPVKKRIIVTIADSCHPSRHIMLRSADPSPSSWVVGSMYLGRGLKAAKVQTTPEHIREGPLEDPGERGGRGPTLSIRSKRDRRVNADRDLRILMDAGARFNK